MINFMKRLYAAQTIVALLLLAPAYGASAQQTQQRPFFDGASTPASKEVMRKAAADIEKYRKGDFRLVLVDKKGAPVKNAQVTVDLANHQFDFGTNFYGVYGMSPELREKVYSTTKEIFNKIVVIDMFNKVPDQHLADAQKSIAWAQANDMRMRMHAMLYHEPRWIMHKDLTQEQCWQLIEDRIKFVAEHYRGQISEYDIINEMLSSIDWNKNQADKDRFELWAPNYPRFEDVAQAKRVFDLVRKYMPDEKLVGLEAQMPSLNNPLWIAVVNYWKELIAMGGQLDYIGTQCHFWQQGLPFPEGGKDAGPDLYEMAGISPALDLLGSLGKPVVITEFNGPSRSNKDKPEVSQKIWTITDEENAAWQINFYRLAFSKPYIRELVRWYDVDNIGGKSMDGGLLHADGTPHQIYYDLKKLIKEEWHTRVEGNTDRDGALSLRGFYGEYTVTVPGYRPARAVLFNDSPKTVRVVLEK